MRRHVLQALAQPENARTLFRIWLKHPLEGELDIPFDVARFGDNFALRSRPILHLVQRVIMRLADTRKDFARRHVRNITVGLN